MIWHNLFTFRKQQNDSLIIRQMRTYRMLQVYFIRFNACFGTLLFGSHHLFLYIMFVMTSYLLFQGHDDAALVALRIALLFIVLIIEWCETHYTDTTAECQEFIHMVNAKTRIKRSSQHLPLIRLELGAGLFYGDLQFFLTFLDQAVNHLISMLLTF